MQPLSMSDIGTEVEIQQCRIKGDLKKHTESLGIIPGGKITPVSKNESGLIIKIKDCRFAINLGVASKILVS